MAGASHHFLPHFLLRRFAVPDGAKKGHIYRLDLKSGTSVAAVPKTEAAKRHYYRLSVELDAPDGMPSPEELLAMIENGAACGIQRIEGGQQPTAQDREYLAFFVALQVRRTPAGRAQLRFMDELVAKLTSELKLQAPKQVHAMLMAGEPTMTMEEAEAQRLEMLRDLESGQLVVQSTPDREICLMFNGLDSIVPLLVSRFDWTAVSFPEGATLVLPDTGLSRYDPTPTTPQGGTGFASSPNAETVMPVSPTLALVIRPGSGRFAVAAGDEDDLAELNLRSYASSHACLYAPSQEVASDLRSAAKRNPVAIKERTPAPETMWIADEADDVPGRRVEFVGHTVNGQKRARFSVSPLARGGQRIRPEDLW